MLGGLLRGAISIILTMNAALADELLHKQQPVLCVGENSSISQLQGEGKRSPFVNKNSKKSYRSDKVFTVQGVVTKLKLGREAGFFIQQTTNTPLSLASTGIFVSTDTFSNIKLDTSVCVSGFVEEYYGMTRLQPTADVQTLASAVSVKPTNIMVATADTDFSQTLERYEGMKVRLVNATDMRVTKPLHYIHRWQRYSIILSHQRINLHPNTTAWPGSIAADQQALANKQRRLYLQLASGESLTSSLDYMRVNDRVSGIVGVITFSYGEFRLLVDDGLSQARFQHISDRETLAPRTDNHLRIASFNLLNYFNSAAGGGINPLRQNRGARTLSALRKQEVQLRDAIVALDADFIGLMEMENNGFAKQSAIRRLLGLVNQAITEPSKHYAVLKPPKSTLHQGRFLGTGAITVAGFYRPTKLKMINTRVIELPIQRSHLGNAYHRPALTATFMRLNYGVGIDGDREDDQERNRLLTKQKGKRLTISVNHFKSKGSKCFEDRQRAAITKKLKRNRNIYKQSLDLWQRAEREVDRQGHCAQFRATAASVLAQALANESGSKIILGDLNSYPQEDPLLLLTDYDPARYGYYNIAHSEYNYSGKRLLTAESLVGSKAVTGFGYHDPFVNHPNDSWTYSFNALGRLDYILLSPDLVSSLVTKKVWHINAAESRLLSDREVLKQGRSWDNRRAGLDSMINIKPVFSSSDHEPLFIELK
ncbi:ExeM/NucH family extracellular endonuclease [Moritella sp. Urea-trap-13]|uniref:ExeM/NucH family extracellular endonuclease n=1 Tax=Moritella sp. Urea-trap-13 TaxID=2058327 RepID=UPI000C330586|nr:ExeM/NucH family extracellular endonuclease [Moritella sp. Urea-trap-13]PKH06701.1 nuclease [Moritella sp. Urea-trap-13]